MKPPRPPSKDTPRPVTGQAPTTSPGVPRPASAESETWINDRWLAPVLDLPELRQQVRRGKTLARKGWVRDLTIRPGLLTAEVTSDSGETHSVKVRMDVIDGPTWVAVVEAISDEAALLADLLRGRLSQRLAEIFEEAGHDLFPFDLRDVSNYCSCREDAAVCTGAVATHIHFAEVIQADPMKLLHYRGKDKDWLVDEVRGKRGGVLQTAARGGPATGPHPRPLAARDEAFEKAGDALREGFWQKADLPTLTFSIDAAELGEADVLPVIRALGPGPGNTTPEEVIAALEPLLRTGKLRVEQILNRVETESEQPMPDEVEPLPTPESLDEMVIAAARKKGQLTTGFVAKALGLSAREARELLQELVTAGRLKVIGKARGTRYLPPEAPDPTPAEVAAAAAAGHDDDDDHESTT
ncbi:MAG: hypothetical protein U1F43_13250 [Myxococcota bacterium]